MPTNFKLDAMTDSEIMDAVATSGGANAAARSLGIPLSTFKDRAQKIIRQSFASQRAVSPDYVPVPRRGVTRYIFSSAQDSTDVDLKFLRNLEAYAKHLGATIQIAGYTYNKSLFEDHSKTSAEFHPRIRKYLTTTQLNIADKLLFCAEMNILPTQTDPLSGFETYTRSKWGVFPHPRVTLKSVPVMWNAPPKIIMSTGTVTKPNYVPKKAGIKAEFHHVIGAVLVEIDADGDIFARHLIAEKDGAFQDLCNYVSHGGIETNAKVEAITWGDTHPELLAPDVAIGAWGIDVNDLSLSGTSPQENMLDFLEPSYQFFHDALDFRRRNHHSINDPHTRFESYWTDKDVVEDEITNAAFFLERSQRDWCHTVVVDSNHDRALLRWLKTGDYRTDPANALFFLTLQKAYYQAIADKQDDFLLAEFAFRNTGCDIDDVTFLKNTDSFTICDGAIECALHGDLGANGARGHINSFAKMGPKANIAHTHSAAIYEGIYVAGHSCRRDMKYNRGGLTSWSPSHIVTYGNGKRTIVTMQGSKFCALG
jgi:hypothetical protein